MERLIQDANEWGAANGRASDLSIESFSDVVTAIEQIQEKQGIAGTTAKEAMTTIEGSMNATKAAWRNLVTEFGKPDADIGARISDMVTALFGEDGEGGLANNVVKEVKVIASNVAAAMPEVASTMFGTLKSSIRDVIESQFGEEAAGTFDKVLGGLESLPEKFSGVADSLGSYFDTVKSTAQSAFGGLVDAIVPVLPKLQEVAVAAGPVISAGIDAGSKAVSALGKVFNSVVPLITPFVSMISDVLVDHVFPALQTVMETVGSGFEAWGNIVSSVVEAVEPVIVRVATTFTDVFGVIADAIGGVASFIADPIGTIKGGIEGIAYSAEDSEGRVSSSMDGIQAYTERATKKSAEALDRYNRKPLSDKKAKATVNGNAIDGKAKKSLDDTRQAAERMKDRSVTVTVSQRGMSKSEIDRIRDSISQLKDKNVTLTTHNVTKNTTVTEHERAWGGIRRHARGDIMVANNPGPGVPLDIVGEAGPEAIVPLTSRYGEDFARMMGKEAAKEMAGSGPTINIYLSYDASADAQAMVSDIATELELLGLTGV